MTLGETSDAANVSRRFRSGADWFIASEQHGVQTFQIGANSERAVDLMHALAMHFPEHASVAVSSTRNRQAWNGSGCSRAEVREMLARLKLLLASHGGVEIAIYNSNDQLTLTPELQVVVYSRTSAWRARLLDMGLEERFEPPPVVWYPSLTVPSHAPELIDSLALAVGRLGLASTEYDLQPVSP